MKQVQALAEGIITWVGVNPKRMGHLDFPMNRFSQRSDSITIHSIGIKNDQYALDERALSSHDDYYKAITGLPEGAMVRNERTITITDEEELAAGSSELGYPIEPGQLRENIVVRITKYYYDDLTFSRLPRGSVMVINGQEGVKALRLNEQNGPCITIARPWATFHEAVRERKADLADRFVDVMEHRRGKMASVMSTAKVTVSSSDTFTIFPPDEGWVPGEY